MALRFIFLIVLFYDLSTSEASKNNLELPDYEYYQSRHYVDKPPLRQRFLQRRNKKRVKDMRIKLLTKYSSNDTVYLDEVAHIMIKKRLSSWNKTNEIEVGIKTIFAAMGVNYVYKRDHFWRTWKKVVYPKNITKVVCYKCNNIINSTCEKCHNTGFWIIEEEPPPCSLELYSVISPQQVCGAKFTQVYNYTDPCPHVLNFAEILSSCDNPIRTSYRITRLFKESKSLPTAICGQSDYCEISTFYRIYKDYALFRVINSSNDIIYSRVMKPGKKNYACIENCGHMDSKTYNVTNDKPLSVSLLPKRSVKRESSFEKFTVHSTTIKKRTQKKYKVKTREKTKLNSIDSESQNTLRYRESSKNSLFTIQELLNNVNAKYFFNNTKPVTESTCTRLGKQATTEFNEVEIVESVDSSEERIKENKYLIST